MSVFAEPVFGDQPDKIDWYSDIGSGGFVPWPNLSSEQKSEARQNLRRAIELIRGTKDNSDPRFDKLIEAALQVPSENDVLVSDGRPLLVRWGMTSESSISDVAVVDQILAQGAHDTAVPELVMAATAHTDDTSPSVRGSNVSTLLLSMTLTVLTLTISSLLALQNCGLAVPKFLTGGRTVLLANFCTNANELYNPNTELLARLERELQERIGACSPSVSQAQGQDQSPSDGGAVTSPEFEKAVKSGLVEKVLLRIYDNTSEDGDVVTVTAPGYKRTITLTNAGATFEVPLVRGEMKLYGEHDGGGGITVSVALTDGTHIVDGSMKVGEQISLTVPH
ncbi:MAG: hypothetical protein ABJN98_06760 [Roseibium sp.]